jgi:thermolabile hemolysin
MARRRWLLVLFLVIGWGAGEGWGQSFSRVVIFGDSLSDVGNVYHQTFGITPQSPPHYEGRFSNGPVWAEHLAWGLGLGTPVRSRSGGFDYAYGGARTGGGSVTFWPFSFPNIGTQINSYLANHTPAGDELFVVWGGGNDLMSTSDDPAVPAGNVAGHVTALAGAGAVNFVVPNLPPLGQIPRYVGTANEGVMDGRALEFNGYLAGHLAGLEGSAGVNVFKLDVAGLFYEMFADPGAWGLTNVREAAYSGGTVAEGVEGYLFWDDVHPSATGHGLLGEAAVEEVRTRRWVGQEAEGAWGEAGNWWARWVPGATSIAVLENDGVAEGMTAVVSGDVLGEVVVERLRVRGSGPGSGPAGSGMMRVLVEEGAGLWVGGLALVEGGGMVELTGGGFGAGELRMEGGGLGIRLEEEMSAIEVVGLAELDGELVVRTAEGFVPLPGRVFEVMRYGARAGEVEVVNETGYVGLSFEAMYGVESMSLAASAMGGDANLDGMVNIADLGILAGNWQGTGDWLSGDFNGDGVVNIADLGVLAGNWQAGVGGAHGDAAGFVEALGMFDAFDGVVVPEPVAALGGLVGLGMLRRRWPRSRSC